jgi:hypothetical protein
MKLATVMMLAVLAMLYIGMRWAEKQEKRERLEKRDR